MSSQSQLRIALIPGDGIGPEIMAVAEQALRTLFPDGTLEMVCAEAGWGVFERTGKALPSSTVELLRSCDGALFGAVSSPSRPVKGYRSPIVALRRELDLFANLRPLVSAPVPSARPNIDILLVRENTEGLYVGHERLDDEGLPTEVATAERRISRVACERIADAACRAAVERRAQGRPGRLTIAHKANVLRLSDGLFRRACLEVAERFPELDVEEQLVDSLLYRLILEPERYDVIVAPNLYGDLLADAGAALVGGLGLAPSANTGHRDGRPWVLAEPVHGSAPDIAGLGIANPVAMLSATVLLLDGLGRVTEASRLKQAVDEVLRSGPWTSDLGGTATTAEVGTMILRRLAGETRSVAQTRADSAEEESSQETTPHVAGLV